MVASVHPMLEIDAAAVADQIERYLRRLVGERHADGLLLGLSGGIDSAVLTALATRALGPDKVFVELLLDRDSERRSEQLARRIAAQLGLELRVQNISPAMRERGVYAPMVMHFVTWSRTFNRFIQHSYRTLFGETPFASSLRKGGNQFGRQPLQTLVFDLTVRHFEAGFNARHRHRRELLEKRAAAENLLLIGAANRSESLVGWFVKDGIDDLYIQPLLDLYKTQVWQLADYLDLPEAVRHQAPSPDMMRGITDEFAIGIAYRTLDLIFAGLEHGMTEAEIESLGPTGAQIRLAKELNHLSGWKRSTPHAAPPVTGCTNCELYAA